MAAEQTKSTVIPGLRYRDAPAAIDWLCNVLGFEKQLVVPGDTKETVLHAQLRLGGGMIMLGSVSDNDFGRLMKQPDEIGGRETQCSYVVVDDADVIYEKAKASGAEILMPIKDEEYGGRAFTCRDPECHIWAVGTYNPW
jgi:uncharacterized glyoxalase superfamily protein PhnB